MSLKLANELMAAALGEGSSVKKKKTYIKWLKQIKLLRTLSGKAELKNSVKFIKTNKE